MLRNSNVPDRLVSCPLEFEPLSGTDPIMDLWTKSEAARALSYSRPEIPLGSGLQHTGVLCVAPVYDGLPLWQLQLQPSY